MVGLRTQESSKFESFFSLVQNAARDKEAIFFLDTGEGRDIILPDMEGENLSGWLIPAKLANSFQRAWKNFSADLSDWDEYARLAVWRQSAGVIQISFQAF